MKSKLYEKIVHQLRNFDWIPPACKMCPYLDCHGHCCKSPEEQKKGIELLNKQRKGFREEIEKMSLSPEEYNDIINLFDLKEIDNG